ncbi:ribbon-helix-helix domain-containing protein [Kiloniella sp. b19]|uniref:ribbon-helix-helix domain-containing protein n=1 Tax=Kiloniella sp. GXU_MW_B19 TaxID=3141326 RepID=UPI0031DA9F11
MSPLQDDRTDALKLETPLVRKRSVTIAGHRTSLSLEEPFWQDLKMIAGERNKSLSSLIEDIDEARTSNLSSALRLFVLDYFKQKVQTADETGPSDLTG